MKILTEISDDSKQLFTVVLENNQTFNFALEFLDQQERWIYNLTYEPADLTIQGSSIVNSPNILRQFERIIDFGIGIITDQGDDPSFIDDFSSGRATINILTAEEVQAVEETFYSAI